MRNAKLQGRSSRSRQEQRSAVAMKPDKVRPKPATRHRIMHAALVEFARHGFHGASMKTISENAGVANGTVFWHFQTKSRLYLMVVEWAAEEFHRSMLPLAEAPGVPFMHVVDTEVAFLREHPEIDALLSSLRSEHPSPEVRESARHVDARSMDIWRRWMAARGTIGGELPSDGSNLPRLIASTVSGVLATRFIDTDVDVRAVLADFAALVPSLHDQQACPSSSDPSSGLVGSRNRGV